MATRGVCVKLLFLLPQNAVNMLIPRSNSKVASSAMIETSIGERWLQSEQSLSKIATAANKLILAIIQKNTNDKPSLFVFFDHLGASCSSETCSSAIIKHSGELRPRRLLLLAVSIRQNGQVAWTGNYYFHASCRAIVQNESVIDQRIFTQAFTGKLFNILNNFRSRSHIQFTSQKSLKR